MKIIAKNLWTPNAIEVLLHHHVCVTKHPRASAPAVKQATVMWLDNGCMVPDGDAYALTDRGRAFIDLLLETPLPVAEWVDPRFLKAGN